MDNKTAQSVQKILKAHESELEADMLVGKKIKGVKPSMLHDEYLKTGNPIFKEAAEHKFKQLFQ